METEIEELRERVVRKELSWDHVRLAAFLGDATAAAVFQRAPTTLEAYASPPAPRRSLWARLRGRGSSSPLQRWVQSLERLSPPAKLQLASAVAEHLVEPWRIYNPRRPEPLEAIAWARSLRKGSGDRVERQQVLEACVSSPPGSELRGPLRHTAAVLALWLYRATGEDSLADLVPAVVELLATAIGDAAGRVAAEGRLAGGASDFEAWEAARVERERAGTTQRGEEVFRLGVCAELIPWLLTAPEIDPQAPLLPRRPDEAKAALDSLIHVSAQSVPEPESLVSALAGFGSSGGVLGFLLGAAAEDRAIDARLAKANVLDDPHAKWDCPKCAGLNPNTTRCCTSCGFLLH